MFSYIIDPEVLDHIRLVRYSVRKELVNIEIWQHEGGAVGLVSMWDEFLPSEMQNIVLFAQANLLASLSRIEAAFAPLQATNPTAVQIMQVVQLMRQEVQAIQAPDVRPDPSPGLLSPPPPPRL